MTDFCEKHEENMKKHSVGYLMLATMAYTTLVIMAVALITVLVWIFWPYNIVSYDPPTDYPIVAGVTGDNFVEQNGTIVYAFEYRKNANIVPVVSKRFIDGLIFQAVENNIALAPGAGRALVETHIPETLPPGTYVLEITRAFKVNPIRTITLVSQTETFTVTAKEE